MSHYELLEGIALRTRHETQGAIRVRLGLTLTLYFKDGHRQERKLQVIECFKDLQQRGAPLNHMVHERFCTFATNRFERALTHIRSTAPNEQFELYVGSATGVQEADAFSMATLNICEVHKDLFQSYLKLVVPLSFLKDVEGSQRFNDWLLYLVNQTGADHGYAGLTAVLPYDFDLYLPAEYELAKQYPGLEVDTQPQSLCLYLADAIKGVNWYTVISHRFVERLGGQTELRRKLEGCAGVECFDYDNGLVIRAGALPELGTPEKPPAAYVAVNRILKPLRITNPQSLHYYSPYNNMFDETSSERWYARFDVDDSPPAIPTKLAAGQPCSVTGFWSSPAGPNSRRHFTAGEIMPEFKGSSWGATFWHWAGED